jgi:ubiquinone/menaquinone biosynthesis C-methylase UbiE
MGAEYHLSELKVALDPTHPSHVSPPALPPGQRVLDVGCGAGQTLIASYPDRVSYGLDIDMSALRLGQSLTDKIRFVRGSANTLPYASESFDMIIARVSLNYVNLPAALSEIRRVLRKGGQVWMTLHRFPVVWNQAKHSNWRGWIFFVYILANSFLFHLLQKQFSLLGRYESFPTARGLNRALRKNCFEDISIEESSNRFLVTARVGVKAGLPCN